MQSVLSHTPALEASWTLSEERLGLVLMDTTVESPGLSADKSQVMPCTKHTLCFLLFMPLLKAFFCQFCLFLTELPHKCPYISSPLCFLISKRGLIIVYRGRERISGVIYAEVHVVSGLAMYREPYLQASPHFPLSTCCTFHSSSKAQCKCLSSLLAESVSLISVLLEAW